METISSSNKMDLITLEEMLWHYVSRMNLALEIVEQQNKDLEEVISLLEEAYKTPNGLLMKEKLELIKEDTKDVQTHYEDALYFLRRQISELEELSIL